MFKLSSLILVFILVSACVKTEPSNVKTGGSALSGSPKFWPNDPFPMKIYVSDAFTEDEYDALKDGAEKWESTVGNKDWFDFQEDRISEISNTSSGINTLAADTRIGVYKTLNWPYDSQILALVNQLLMVYNKNTASQYVHILKADMLVNVNNNTFKTGGSGYGFDLQTVTLHEFGHVLGLDHTSDTPFSLKNTSVMFPSINSSDVRRDPFQYDINALADLYNITLSGSGNGLGASAVRAPANEERYTAFDDGEVVMMQVELRTDGECIHKENGVIVHRHHSPHRK